MSRPSATSGSRIPAYRKMPSRTCVVCVALAVVLLSSTAEAQLDTFVQAVAQLAQAATQPQAARVDAIRTATDRLANALAEWDRRIAMQEAASARKQDGSDADSYRRHLELGVTYCLRGRFIDALREFDAAAAARANASEVHVLRALTLDALRRSDEAARAFAAAWTLDDRNPIAAYNLLVRPGAGTQLDRERALRLLTESYQRDPFELRRPTSGPFVSLGAIPDSLARSPIVGDSTTTEAFTLLTQARFTEAIAALRQPRGSATSAGADVPLLHFLRAQQDERMGDIASARQHYQQALAGALLGRGAIYVAIARLAQVEGDTTAAVDALTSAARLNPNDPYLHKELAAALASQGRVDDAFCELMATLLIDPADAHAHATMGQLFLDAERDREAVRAFSRALELRPDAFEVRYGLATALARLGNAAESARQFEQFERARREAQERRRRDIASDVDSQTAPLAQPAGQDAPR
jgi:tetratricopeptide (TPR) repeat protein